MNLAILISLPGILRDFHVPTRTSASSPSSSNLKWFSWVSPCSIKVTYLLFFSLSEADMNVTLTQKTCKLKTSLSLKAKLMEEPWCCGTPPSAHPSPWSPVCPPPSSQSSWNCQKLSPLSTQLSTSQPQVKRTSSCLLLLTWVLIWRRSDSSIQMPHTSSAEMLIVTKITQHAMVFSLTSVPSTNYRVFHSIIPLITTLWVTAPLTVRLMLSSSSLPLAMHPNILRRLFVSLTPPLLPPNTMWSSLPVSSPKLQLFPQARIFWRHQEFQMKE